MDYQRPKIEFYRQRTFSEKLNVVFDFIRENAKPLLKYTFYVITPVCLIQAFCMNSFLSTYVNVLSNANMPNDSLFENSMMSFVGNYGIVLLCYILGSAIMSGLIYAMMQTYAVRENRLRDVTINDFKSLLVKNAGKYLLLFFVMLVVFVIIVVVMASLAALTSAWSLVVTIPLMLVCVFLMIPLSLVVPVYIFEPRISFSDAVRKAWKLGFATLGGLIGLMIVLYIISSVIQTFTMLPWYLMTFVGTVLSLGTESTINQSILFKFVHYILGLLQSFGMYIASIIAIIGLAFQYFHAREKVEGVTIESNISNFGNL